MFLLYVPFVVKLAKVTDVVLLMLVTVVELTLFVVPTGLFELVVDELTAQNKPVAET